MRLAKNFVPMLAMALAAAPLLAQSKPASPPAAPAQSRSSVSASGIEAQEGIRGKQLILKDGTFQLVREYQVIGDRVRFYSVERGEWEEIPASLVDWPATRKAEAQPNPQARQALDVAHNLDIEKHPGDYDIGPGLGLPPDVLLPPGQGVFAFDGHKILKLTQDLAKSKLNKGRFLASLVVPVPVLTTRYTVFLEGKHAVTRVADTEPLLFYRSATDTEPQLRLLRAKVKGNRRQIELLDIYFGQKSTQTSEIPLDVLRVYSDTYRLSANEDLAPGEYVLAEVNPHEGIDLDVWDFGIDGPSAKPAKPAHKK